MRKRTAQEIENDASRASAQMRRQMGVGTSQIMGFKTEHEAADQRSTSAPTPIDLQMEIRTIFDCHSLTSECEPTLMKNWCIPGRRLGVGVGELRTPVKTQGTDQINPSGSVLFGINPTESTAKGALIKSPDGKSVYRIIRDIGKSAFLASAVDVSTTKDIAGKEVVLKIVSTQPHFPMDSTPEAFARYVLQRSYGECIPSAVHMRDAFMFAAPTETNLNVVIAMEKMDGNVLDLIRNVEALQMCPAARYAIVLELACKMARAVFDLELQQVFHDNIKPQNFLCRKLGGNKCEVKVTDFDLGTLAGEMRSTTKIARGELDENVRKWVHIPGVRYLLHSKDVATELYKPPEYKLVRAMIHKMGESLSRNAVGMRLPNMDSLEDSVDFMNKNMFNTDWLSRMMAFELIASIREMFLAAGVSPYYTADCDYPVDIMNPHGSLSKRAASTLVRMDFNGPHNIAPSSPTCDTARRMTVWNNLRLNTVHLRDLRSEQMQGAEIINNLIANVLAPNVPKSLDGSVHCPIGLVEISAGNVQTLCANRSNFATIRPTTYEVLKILMGAAAKSGSDASAISIPTSTQSVLNANILMM